MESTIPLHQAGRVVCGTSPRPIPLQELQLHPTQTSIKWNNFTGGLHDHDTAHGRIENILYQYK